MFRQERELGQRVVVERFKSLEEVVFGTVSRGVDDKQAVFVFRNQDEVVVVTEVVEQKQPEIDIVDVEEVKANAVVGVGPVRRLPYMFHRDEEEQHGHQEQFGDAFHQVGIAFHCESICASIKPPKVSIFF